MPGGPEIKAARALIFGASFHDIPYLNYTYFLFPRKQTSSQSLSHAKNFEPNFNFQSNHLKFWVYKYQSTFQMISAVIRQTRNLDQTKYESKIKIEFHLKFEPPKLFPP